MLLALRAGGEQIGWGFQLQSPLFVTLMIYLLLAVGLNLSGVFEVGGGLAGVGDGLTQGDSYRASFFTGVLTTLVATPCTAPFMAAAVGAALTQSPLVALWIFAALGRGSVAALFAAVARSLDAARPAEARRVDGHAEADFCVSDVRVGRVAVVGSRAANLLARSGRRAGRRDSRCASRPGRTRNPSGARPAAAWLRSPPPLAAVLLAIVLPVRFADVAAASPVARTAPPRRRRTWQPYDAGRVEPSSMRSGAAAAGQFHRELVLDLPGQRAQCVRRRRRAADFSRQGRDADEGRLDQSRSGDHRRRWPHFGRAGVPLYVVYNSKPGSAAPVVLPQLLTAGHRAKTCSRISQPRFEIAPIQNSA